MTYFNTFPMHDGLLYDIADTCRLLSTEEEEALDNLP